MVRGLASLGTENENEKGAPRKVGGGGGGEAGEHGGAPGFFLAKLRAPQSLFAFPVIPKMTSKEQQTEQRSLEKVYKIFSQQLGDILRYPCYLRRCIGGFGDICYLI